MSPVIRVSDSTYEKLQMLAKPFVDTPDAVIARLTDAALEGTGADQGIPMSGQLNGVVKNLDPGAPGSLTHAKLRFARFDGEVVQQPNWNKLSRIAHSTAMSHIPSLEALRQISEANIRPGRYVHEGFAYLADVDISIQGQDSGQAWRSAYALAKELGFPIEVVVEWHNKTGAAHPGEQRKITWSPHKAKSVS